MRKTLLRSISIVLALVFAVNLLPLPIFAEEVNTYLSRTAASVPATAAVLGEVTQQRDEFSKTFKLSNGLYLAAVYPEAVHYETTDGQWAKIDNTLKADGAAYTNTAGLWDVSFPQNLTSTSQITITKDGYTLAFGMAGELRRDPDAEVLSIDTENAILKLKKDLSNFRRNDKN